MEDDVSFAFKNKCQNNLTQNSAYEYVKSSGKARERERERERETGELN